MRRVSIVTLAVWIATAAWVRAQDSPVLESAVDIGIDVGSYSAPTMADWDNDGRKHLIVGQRDNSGKIRLYMNQGTDQAPVFGSSTFIKSRGSDITTPDRGC